MELAVSVADAQAVVAEICGRLSASVAADCIPVLASTWGLCAASAADTLRVSHVGSGPTMAVPARALVSGSPTRQYHQTSNSCVAVVVTGGCNSQNFWAGAPVIDRSQGCLLRLSKVHAIYVCGGSQAVLCPSQGSPIHLHALALILVQQKVQQPSQKCTFGTSSTSAVCCDAYYVVLEGL